MKVLDVFSWLPAKEISIDELEQIFIEHLNGTYEGEYKVLLEMPDNADKNILNSRKGCCLHFERRKCYCCCGI